MNVSLYQAAAAMNAHERWQEVIANNLANCSIPGARKQDVSFEGVQSSLPTGTSGAEASTYVVPRAVATTNFQPGILRATGVSTDLAIEGKGFLEVQLPSGNRGYTRDGELQLNSQGQLITKAGYVVQSEAGAALQIDPTKGTTFNVSSTGEISQDGESKGKVKLVDFSQPDQLTYIGGGCYQVGDSQAQSVPATSARLHQGYLEGSNTTPTQEMSSLITAMRMFETNQKVIQMQDDRMGKIITDLGTPAS